MIEFIKRTATGKIALLILICFFDEMIALAINKHLYIEIIYTFGLNPNLDIHNLIMLPITLITNMFLHGGFVHVLFNLVTLLSFGPIVEAIVGEREFLKIYFGSGIIGGILFIIVCNVFGSHGIAIGASGAIAGLLGFLAVVRPNIQVFFYMIPMNIVLGTLLFIVISLILIISVNPNAFGIAHAAHLGGVLFGIYYGFEKIRERIDYF